MPWSAQPADSPAIALAGSGSARAVYASWNGATAVHSWQLLAGEGEDTLRAVAQTRSLGFESSLRVGAAGPLVAVVALDAGGRALGRSPVVSVA